MNGKDRYGGLSFLFGFYAVFFVLLIIIMK